MKQIVTIFKFTFLDGLRKKAFLVSTMFILVFVLAACLGLNFFGDDQKEPAQAEQSAEAPSMTCWYIDDDKLISAGAEALRQEYPEYAFKAGDSAQMDEYKSKIKEDADYSLILIQEKGGVPSVTILSKDFMSGVDAEGISAVLGKSYGAQTLAEKGYSAEDIAVAQTALPYETQVAGNMNVSGYVISLLLTFLMFFAIYYYGYGVAMSIATEKTSRVMETLVISAKPSRILIGKCLGMGALGLLQFGVLLAFGGVCYKLLVGEGKTFLGMELDFSGISVGAFLLLLVYFVLGYALYAVMNSVCGALVSKIEDLNSAMMPVMLIAIVSFYVGYVASAVSTAGTLAKVAVYIPFTSPFIMPTKILNDQVEPLQLVISIGLMLIVIGIVTAVSVKIYSASVLHYGGRQKLIKLYREKV